MHAPLAFVHTLMVRLHNFVCDDLESHWDGRVNVGGQRYYKGFTMEDRFNRAKNVRATAVVVATSAAVLQRAARQLFLPCWLPSSDRSSHLHSCSLPRSAFTCTHTPRAFNSLMFQVRKQRDHASQVTAAWMAEMTSEWLSAIGLRKSDITGSAPAGLIKSDAASVEFAAVAMRTFDSMVPMRIGKEAFADLMGAERYFGVQQDGTYDPDAANLKLDALVEALTSTPANRCLPDPRLLTFGLSSSVCCFASTVKDPGCA